MAALETQAEYKSDRAQAGPGAGVQHWPATPRMAEESVTLYAFKRLLYIFTISGYLGKSIFSMDTRGEQISDPEDQAE